MAELTQEELKKLLRYEPETGLFYWLVSLARRVKVGDIAGTVKNNGYIRIRINGKMHYSHRLAFFYHYGEWPVDQLDHIDGNPANNRIDNLRDANNSENAQNRGVRSNNRSGFIGVHWYKQSKKWRAEIRINGKQKHLGYFDAPQEAHKAYLEAKAELHQFQPIPRELMKDGGNNEN